MRNSIIFCTLLLLVLSAQDINARDINAQDSGKNNKADTVQKTDSIQYEWERFSVSLGGFLTSINSAISMNGQEMGLGININLEDALGLNTTTTVIRGDAEYNFGSKGRSYIRMGYFGLIRNASKTLESEISIGNTVYPIGTEVNTRFDMHIIRALYDYAFLKDERIMLSVSGGMYVLPVNFSLGTSNIINENAELIAPLPVAGFRNAFLLTPRILLKQNVEVLYVKTSGYKGNIQDLNVWLEYNLFRHLGIGIGLNTFRFNLSAYGETGSSKNFVGTISTGFTGLLFYGKYYF